MAVRTDWAGLGIGVGISIASGCAIVIWNSQNFAWFGLAGGMAITGAALGHRFGGLYLKTIGAGISVAIVVILWVFARPSILPPTQGIQTEYSGLSNAQLKRFVLDFSESLTEFHRKYQAAFDELQQENREKGTQLYLQNADKAARLALMAEFQRKYDAWSTHRNQEYQDKYLAKARELEHELRLRIPDPPAGDPTNDIQEHFVLLALKSGQIGGGPSPAQDLAEYLERRARVLP